MADKGLNEMFSPVCYTKSQHFYLWAKQVKHKKFC